MSDFKEKRPIRAVLKKAKIKPDGYLKDYQKHTYKWDEESGYYWITEENWHILDKRWKPRTIPGNKKSISTIAKSKPKKDYCSEFEKPCCNRKTGMCKITKEKCTTDGIIRCDLVKN
jgi:hypothetical protein